METARAAPPGAGGAPVFSTLRLVLAEKFSSASEFERSNVCFRCLDGGELLLCDHNVDQCPYVYHRACVGIDLAGPDPDSFICPRHVCAVSGVREVAGELAHCYGCPKSFSKDAFAGGDALTEVGGRLLCGTCAAAAAATQAMKATPEGRAELAAALAVAAKKAKKAGGLGLAGPAFAGDQFVRRFRRRPARRRRG